MVSTTSAKYCIREHGKNLVFLPLYTHKQFRTILNSPIHSCVLREITCDIEICPALVSPAHNESESDENKTGTNKYLYTEDACIGIQYLTGKLTFIIWKFEKTTFS